MNATALIAEDEPVLAQALATMLTSLWPELTLLPPARDGGEAITRATAEQPDILFLDIHMPDRDGLDAAEAIVEAWPAEQPLPLIVFVTAYDQYALAAFERAAVDYVLKPVQTTRMAATCQRLKAQLKLRTTAQDDGALAGTLQALRSASLERQADLTPSSAPLTVIQAAMGSGLLMIPIEEVQYFEAADKYVRVITPSIGATGAEVLIRTPLRELLPRLNPQHFWQVHRSAVVNLKAIERVSRTNGRMRVHLRGRPETLEVGRMYAYQFKAM
ncbi:MAG: LytTR family DNA-binding domain-containing protein [Aquabacterium sp.]|uniref:LytR/AlgR family response regulator transcription factor n=1 Tax=Aquabacterium sp. TaxID=1872578 RepID=UPI00271FEEED|nr:LytTR family DNA-binding domain-containing protein [Aquabacterium sp.]MDO9005974.1 LytTR family DNA-binding domain-containing protein [Aquabacterium sp.]